MKKLVPVVVALGVLMFGFQNCSQQSQKLDSHMASSQPSAKIEDPALSQAQSLDILISENQSVSLDLQSGELRQIVGGAIVKKCLSDSQRGQIQDLLSNSNLCEFPAPGPEVACAQIYSAPYAELHWSDKSVKVGEAYSSCNKDVDLCGNDGMILRGLLRDIVSRWSELSCDFKVVAQ